MLNSGERRKLFGWSAWYSANFAQRRIRDLSIQRRMSLTSSVSLLWTARRARITAAASWSKLHLMGLSLLGSECHGPQSVVDLSLIFPLECWYLVTNWMNLRLCCGSGFCPGFVISKYMASVVDGSMPPRLQALVLPCPMAVSDTLPAALLRDAHGPMHPCTLNSRDVMHSRVAAKPIAMLPASCSPSGVLLKTLLRLSLKTLCPKLSPSTISPPLFSLITFISSIPT
mmetsp:Transcript_20254/g.37803  ORF Transcript_20254/g.37803 Transcript_20254/m.37803 type:complete len:228 (+) Transcript_20254:618-1301(+)